MPLVPKFDTSNTSRTQLVITRMHQASIFVIQHIKQDNHTQITINIHQALMCHLFIHSSLVENPLS
jgi:hypothetical protein